jgi:WD40 repeat protein
VFSPSGKFVAAGAAVYDSTDGHLVRALPVPTPRRSFGNDYDAAFSPDESLLAAGTDSRVNVWDLSTGQVVHTFMESKPGVQWMITVRFSPDGRYLASGSGSWDSDGTGRAVGYVVVWDLQTGKEAFRSPGQPDGIYGMAWSPDGKRLASASGRYLFGGPGGVHVWEPATGRLALDLKGHANCVWAVTFSPDGRRIVSAGGPFDSHLVKPENRSRPRASELRVWDADSGQEVLACSTHMATAYGAAFSVDGMWFATAGWDKLIRVWHLSPARAVAGAN